MDKETDETQSRWEARYRDNPLEQLPWEEGQPSAELVALIESGIVEKGPALDICCGSGNNALYLAQEGFTCYGIDISPTAVGYARQKVAAEGLSCEVTTGNAVRLPYADETFTLVFDRGCFHSLSPKDRKPFINGIQRVLRRGGKYLLLCFSSRDHTGGPPYAFSPEDIRRYFSGQFKIHAIRETPRGAAGAGRFFLSVLMEKPVRGPRSHWVHRIF